MKKIIFSIFSVLTLLVLVGTTKALTYDERKAACDAAKTASDASYNGTSQHATNALSMKSTSLGWRYNCVTIKGATENDMIPGDCSINEGNNRYSDGNTGVQDGDTAKGNAFSQWSSGNLLWMQGDKATACVYYDLATPKYQAAKLKYDEATDYYIMAYDYYLTAYDFYHDWYITH